mgnify:CR=1 FL=1
MKLKGKVSLVSACGRGIGKEIALTLARQGSNLIINSFVVFLFIIRVLFPFY